MVSITSMVGMIISAVISILLPLALLIYFLRRDRISIRAVLVGILVFAVSQVAVRIPLLNWMSTQEWYQVMAGNLVFLAIFLPLTAGLFEEVGRWLGFSYLLSRQLEWKNGVAYGIGHGGIESILIVGLTMINNIVYSLLINAGTFDALVANQLGQVALTIKTQLISLPSYTFFLAGLERLFTIIIQIGLSLVVLYAVMSRRLIFLLAAILLHALINLPAVLVPGWGYPIWAAEIFVGITALLAFIWIRRSRCLLTPDTVQQDDFQ